MLWSEFMPETGLPSWTAESHGRRKEKTDSINPSSEPFHSNTQGDVKQNLRNKQVTTKIQLQDEGKMDQMPYGA